MRPLTGPHGRLFRLLLTAALALGAGLGRADASGLPSAGTDPSPQAEEEGQRIESAMPIESTEQSIDPNSRPPAARIAERIRAILDTTGAFSELELEVDEGVVFLRGEAADQARKEWASEIAKRVEGVVAVVNDLALKEPPFLDLGPAKRSAVSFVRSGVRAIPQILMGLLVLTLGVLLSRAVGRLSDRWLGPRLDSQILRSTIRRGFALVTFAMAFYLGLEVAGLTGLAATVIGGTGLVGLAFGFAFRDIAENFLSGVLLSVQRPFRAGDTIEVDGFKGVVQGVRSHGTTLMDFDGNLIELSNTSVYKGAVRNFTANPKTRIEISVGVGYDMPARTAQEIVLGVVRGAEVVLDEPKPIALISKLGNSTVEVTVYFWIDGRANSAVRVRSRMLRQMLETLEDEGAPMPDEAREVVFPQEIPVRLLPAPPSGAEVAAVAAEAPSGSEPEEAGNVHAHRIAARTPPREGSEDPEGELVSEVGELQKQAKESREGQREGDILSEAPRS